MPLSRIFRTMTLAAQKAHIARRAASTAGSMGRWECADAFMRPPSIAQPSGLASSGEGAGPGGRRRRDLDRGLCPAVLRAGRGVLSRPAGPDDARPPPALAARLRARGGRRPRPARGPARRGGPSGDGLRKRFGLRRAARALDERRASDVSGPWPAARTPAPSLL